MFNSKGLVFGSVRNITKPSPLAAYPARSFTAMSLITISDLKYITPQNLASKLLSSSPPPSDLAIVDVRDSGTVSFDTPTTISVVYLLS